MSSSKQLKIVIVEPSPVIGRGLKVLLDECPEFIVQEVYCDFQSFYEHQTDYTPDIILINPSVISLYKQFSVKTLFSENAKTIFIAILYKYVNPESISGFDGTLDIYDDSSAMVAKLHEVVKSSHSKKSGSSDENTDLSEREKEILAAVAKGLTNKEIADKYHLSVHTVVSHRKNITRKIGIKTVSGLTIYAMFNNIISQNDLR